MDVIYYCGDYLPSQTLDKEKASINQPHNHDSIISFQDDEVKGVDPETGALSLRVAPRFIITTTSIQQRRMERKV